MGAHLDRWLGTVLTLLALLAPAASGGEGGAPSEAARRALDTLVGRVTDRLPPTGPSLTRCVADLVSRGDADVRAVLGEFWAMAAVKGSPAWWAAEDVESIVRLMYGFLPQARDPERCASFRICEGAVLDEEPDGADSLQPYRPDLPPLAELLVGRTLRPAPAPSADALLALVREGLPESFGREARRGLFSALGEAAAARPESAAELVKLYADADGDEFFALALGLADTPECRQGLIGTVLSAARALAAGPVPEAEERMLRWQAEPAAAQLRAKAMDLVRGALGESSGPLRCALLDLLGPPIAVPFLLDGLDASKTREERLAALSALLDAVLRSHGGRPLGRDVPRLLGALLAAAPELPEVERSRLFRAAECLFFHGFLRFPPRAPFEESRERFEIPKTLVSAEPCPEVEVLALRLAEDLAAGRIRFLDFGEEPGLHEPRTLRLGWEWIPAQSKVAPPDDYPHRPAPGFPVFAGAEWTGGGLEITLQNVGEEPFLVSPLLARYARAVIETPCVRRGTHLGIERTLTLELLAVDGSIATRREDLVRLDPGRAFTWTQAVLPAHRDVKRVVLRMGGGACPGGLTVLGGAEIPLLTEMADTWVR